MPRIRSIHPGLFTDEAFMALTVEEPLAVALLIGLWTEADDQGVFEWKPFTIKARVLPATTQPVEPLLERLAAANFLCRFEVGEKVYGAVRNFRRWQRPEKPKAVHPLADELRSYVGLIADQSPTGSAPDGGPSPKKATPKRSPSPTKPPAERAAAPTSPRPVADQSPNSSAEVGGRMEEVGGKKTTSSAANDPARASPAGPDAAGRIVVLFDKAQEVVYGDQRRQLPSARDYTTATRLLEMGLTEADAQPLFEAILRRCQAAKSAAPRSLGYVEGPVADHVAQKTKPLPQGRGAGEPEGAPLARYEPEEWLTPEQLAIRKRILA